MVVVGELEAFALKSDWGIQHHPLLEVSRIFTASYAQIDAYSQGKLKEIPLPPGMSARNMGKNDLWIAATALYFGIELHTTDNDFDHLRPLGLQLVKP